MFEQLVEIFQIGGWVMGGILLCSVLALAVFLEKLWSLRGDKVIPMGFSIEVEDLVRREKIPEAITLCRKSNSSLANIIRVGLENAGWGRERIKEGVNETGEREASELSRYMNLLNTTIIVAPMLGFLGTVLGMLQLFSSVAEVGEVTNIGMIAGGIYKALYTTTAGLVVAIPATLFYRYLKSRIDRFVLRMEEISLRIVDLIIPRGA